MGILPQRTQVELAAAELRIAELEADLSPIRDERDEWRRRFEDAMDENKACEARIAELEAQVAHLTKDAGGDSCADYMERNAKLEAALREASLYIANFWESALEEGDPTIARKIWADLATIDKLLVQQRCGECGHVPRADLWHSHCSECGALLGDAR